MITPERQALRSLWREAAEKRIDAGIDWPGIVIHLLRDLDAAEKRAEGAEAKVARAEELAEEFARYQSRKAAHNGGVSCSVWGLAGAALTRALADTPTIPEHADWQDVQHARHLDAAERNGGDE